MEAVRGTFRSSDGKTDIAYNIWEPSSPAEARAVVQISHGMCEYSGRYAPYAEHLAGQGYIVAGSDHIGHGLSAASPDDLGYIPPEDGPELLVADLHSMTLLLKERYPGKPVVLLGHSMGSFIARYYLSLHAEELEGAVIMGTAGPGAPTGLAAFIASAVGAAKGERHRSKLLTSLAFGSYNKHCAKEEGPFAWLSTDTENVRRYEADPLCGYMFTVAGFKALFSLLGFVNGPDWPKTVPTDLPVLLISGEDDPVGAYGKGVKKVASMLGGEGVKHLTVKLFRGDRHEILNETDRAEVWAYIDRWLGDLPAAAADAGEEDK